MTARAQDDEFSASIRIERMNTSDFRDMEFFQIWLPGNVSVVVSTDSDLEVAKWLRAHQNQRVSLTLK